VLIGVVVVVLWACKLYQAYTTGEIVLKMKE
jgi:hypothetical protein